MTPRIPPVLVVVLAMVALLLPAGRAAGMASHRGWPRIDGVFYINKQDRHAKRHGSHRSDELLGGHGSDHLWGRSRSDVIWGDYKPSGQNTWQVDHLYGGAGNDHIYASHGRNVISGGRGDDIVHAHFGRGRIDCGRGHDVLYVSHRGRRGWHVRHCEVVSYRTEAQRGV